MKDGHVEMSLEHKVFIEPLEDMILDLGHDGVVDPDGVDRPVDREKHGMTIGVGKSHLMAVPFMFSEVMRPLPVMVEAK